MKLFISLIASFFLIAGCGGNEEETRAGDTDTSIPVLANCTQSDGSTLDLLAGSFDCPQVASYNCSVCRLNSSVAMNGNTNVILAYTCTDSIGSVGLTDAASFIQQLGITCSKAAEIETKQKQQKLKQKQKQQKLKQKQKQQKLKQKQKQQKLKQKQNKPLINKVRLKNKIIKTLMKKS